jgi:hypothetical protein
MASSAAALKLGMGCISAKVHLLRDGSSRRLLSCRFHGQHSYLVSFKHLNDALRVARELDRDRDHKVQMQRQPQDLRRDPWDVLVKLPIKREGPRHMVRRQQAPASPIEVVDYEVWQLIEWGVDWSIGFVVLNVGERVEGLSRDDPSVVYLARACPPRQNSERAKAVWSAAILSPDGT